MTTYIMSNIPILPSLHINFSDLSLDLEEEYATRIPYFKPFFDKNFSRREVDLKDTTYEIFGSIHCWLVYNKFVASSATISKSLSLAEYLSCVEYIIAAKNYIEETGLRINFANNECLDLPYRYCRQVPYFNIIIEGNFVDEEVDLTDVNYCVFGKIFRWLVYGRMDVCNDTAVIVRQSLSLANYLGLEKYIKVAIKKLNEIKDPITLINNYRGRISDIKIWHICNSIANHPTTDQKTGYIMWGSAVMDHLDEIPAESYINLFNLFYIIPLNFIVGWYIHYIENERWESKDELSKVYHCLNEYLPHIVKVVGWEALDQKQVEKFKSLYSRHWLL